jgi:hypothetical protein
MGFMTGTEWRDYVLRGGFKRTDKDTELFEATTDVIQEWRRRFKFDEAQADIELTDQITVLGDYTMALESDFGLFQGIVIEDGDTANPLIQISKHEFDEIYPDIHNTNDRGYPEHFTVWGGNILIGPIPDQVSYVYRISYAKRAGTIDIGTDAVPFTNFYREVLRDFVLGRLWEVMDEYERGNYYLSKGERGFEQALRREDSVQGNVYFQTRCQ